MVLFNRHAPQPLNVDGLAYCNTGDWVENRTAGIEDLRVHLKLVWLIEVAVEPDAVFVPRRAAVSCLAREFVPMSA